MTTPERKGGFSWSGGDSAEKPVRHIVMDAASKHARKVYVGNLPPSVSQEVVITHFFNQLLATLLPNKPPGDSALGTYVNMNKRFAFVEMRSIEEATFALGLDGVQMDGYALKLRRPQDYNPTVAQQQLTLEMQMKGGISSLRGALNLTSAADVLAASVGTGGSGGTGGIGGSRTTGESTGGGFEGGGGGGGGSGVGGDGAALPKTSGIVATTVDDGPNKVFIGGLPHHMTEAQVKELLSAFGALRAFHLVKERECDRSKGFAFCEWLDPSVTDIACEELNGMKLADRYLNVRRAIAHQQHRSLTAAALAGREKQAAIQNQIFADHNQLQLQLSAGQQNQNVNQNPSHGFLGESMALGGGVGVAQDAIVDGSRAGGAGIEAAVPLLVDLRTIQTVPGIVSLSALPATKGHQCFDSRFVAITAADAKPSFSASGGAKGDTGGEEEEEDEDDELGRLAETFALLKKEAQRVARVRNVSLSAARGGEMLVELSTVEEARSLIIYLPVFLARRAQQQKEDRESEREKDRRNSCERGKEEEKRRGEEKERDNEGNEERREERNEERKKHKRRIKRSGRSGRGHAVINSDGDTDSDTNSQLKTEAKSDSESEPVGGQRKERTNSRSSMVVKEDLDLNRYTTSKEKGREGGNGREGENGREGGNGREGENGREASSRNTKGAARVVEVCVRQTEAPREMIIASTQRVINDVKRIAAMDPKAQETYLKHSDLLVNKFNAALQAALTAAMQQVRNDMDEPGDDPLNQPIF